LNVASNIIVKGVARRLDRHLFGQHVLRKFYDPANKQRMERFYNDMVQDVQDPTRFTKKRDAFLNAEDCKRYFLTTSITG
jgi:hypothetical protein